MFRNYSFEFVFPDTLRHTLIFLKAVLSGLELNMSWIVFMDNAHGLFKRKLFMDICLRHYFPEQLKKTCFQKDYPPPPPPKKNMNYFPLHCWKRIHDMFRNCRFESLFPDPLRDTLIFLKCVLSVLELSSVFRVVFVLFLVSLCS